MAWLSNEFGEMYQVDDPVYNTYAEELAVTKAATAGATSNYYDASANGGEGGQVYVYSNGSTVTTNNIGQPTSATLPTSQYQGTGGATSSEFRPIEGSPTSTNIGGFQVGIETPTLIGQNNQISYDEYGQPNTLRVQPELSNFDKAMRAGTLALAAAPWAYGAATGFGGASSAGAGGAFTPAAGSGASFAIPAGSYTATGAAGGAMGQALPYTEAFDAWNLAQQGLSSEAIAQNLAATGMDSFLAADVANLAAQGLSEAQIAQVIGASYSAPELTGTAFQSLGWGTAANSLLNASQLANLLKGGSAAATALTGSSGGTSGINPSLLSSLGKLAQGQSGYGMEIPGIVRTNTNPFYNTPQQPIQNPQKTEMSSLADILRQGKSSWQT